MAIRAAIRRLSEADWQAPLLLQEGENPPSTTSYRASYSQLIRYALFVVEEDGWDELV
jgi:hypothetical protein